MALKRDFTDEEKYSLTQEEIKLGVKYLRKHKTAGRIPEPQSLKLLELFLIGHTFHEIHHQFAQYPIGQIILTAALCKWAHDRDKLHHTLKDRVQAKVVKSVIEQVDFLTTLLSVTKPQFRIDSIKEYKEVMEALYKIVAGSVPNSKTKTSPMFNALAPRHQKDNDEIDENDPAKLIEASVDDE